MFSTLPQRISEFMDWPWEKIEPYFQDLTERPLTAENIAGWMADWTALAELIYERFQRLMIATNSNTEDAAAEAAFNTFLDEIFPRAQAADQKLKEKLLESGLEPEGFEIPLRNLRQEADLFREANLPLLSEEVKLGTEYDKIAGAQVVNWEGEDLTVEQLKPVFQNPDRPVRERAWRLALGRQLEDREALNDLWRKLLDVRRRLAENAGEADYRSYRWKQMLRFDYTPEDSRRFQEAIEKVVVPAAERLYERRRQRLGVETLRPWDLNVDPTHQPPLRPFKDVAELEEKSATIFRQVDPQLGEYFETMRRENLLDLDNRKNKAPGAYCTDLPTLRKPFIFGNAVGIHDNVLMVMHEGGHAFHVFESAHLPYIQQLAVPMEFAEVASMSMELLAAPYLTADQGGFYTEPEAARARIEKLESIILFWPYMAVVDAFQHWVYENLEAAKDATNCDAQWSALWDRFMRGVDWSGLEAEKATGWHRKLHIFQSPFYYIEYGLAQLGSVLIWRNALQDQAGAVASYRKALSLGATASLPQLFTAAGARLAFDAATLQEAVDLVERTIDELEQVA